MTYKFNAYGHPNVLATHKTTLEFTKDDEVSLNGDCIVGVKADFNLKKIKQFTKKLKNKNIIIIIETISKDKKIKEKITAEINSQFDSDRELVIRKTDFISERTFAINSNKAAFDLNRHLIGSLKEKKNKISIIIESR